MRKIYYTVADKSEQNHRATRLFMRKMPEDKVTDRRHRQPLPLQSSRHSLSLLLGCNPARQRVDLILEREFSSSSPISVLAPLSNSTPKFFCGAVFTRILGRSQEDEQGQGSDAGRWRPQRRLAAAVHPPCRGAALVVDPAAGVRHQPHAGLPYPEHRPPARALRDPGPTRRPRPQRSWRRRRTVAVGRERRGALLHVP